MGAAPAASTASKTIVARSALVLVALLFTAGPARADFDASFTSPSLSRFFGRPIQMRAAVALPPAYESEPQRSFPAIYVIHAFGASYRPAYREYATFAAALRAARFDAVVVFLDATQPYGHNEFVDSPNDGPWETALTTEFVPYLEAELRLRADAAGRYLVGHSSGGWSSLWLQLERPDFFGGAWAIAPDPVDFHDFAGIDLTRDPLPNFYRSDDGERGFVRERGRDTSTIRAYVAKEAARGHGGQFDSFDAVFSPRGADGRPAALFDRRTGAIDPAVAAYWNAHFDIARQLRERWPAIGSQLAGKLNVFVGSRDTFHLETSVARLADELAVLGGEAKVTFVPGADHFTVFESDGGLIARIVGEIARAASR
ncbi:MAG: hypothetical protein NVSMB19_08840 [Vulcanimicrobiaceae bacterium]